MSEVLEITQNDEHRSKKERPVGIITRILGPMPRWLMLWFQVGAFGTMVLLSLCIVFAMIAAIVTGDFTFFVQILKTFVPNSILGAL